MSLLARTVFLPLPIAVIRTSIEYISEAKTQRQGTLLNLLVFHIPKAISAVHMYMSPSCHIHYQVLTSNLPMLA